MRSRAVAVAALLLVAVAACAERQGVRIEGSAVPVSTPTPSTPSTSVGIARTKEPTNTKQPTKEPTPSTAMARSDVTSMDLPQLRMLLLADPAVDRLDKTQLRGCTIVAQCLSEGPVTNLIPDAAPQRVVIANTAADGFVYAGYLVGAVDGPPRVLSVIRGDGMTFSVGADRSLVVESKVYGPTDAMCCPSGSKAEVYRWNGDSLVRTSEVFKKGS